MPDESPDSPPTSAQVLALAGELALERGHRLLDARLLEERGRRRGMDHDAFVAAVRALAAERLVDARFFQASQVTLLRLTEAGLHHHLRATGVDLEEVRARVMAAARAEAEAGRLGEALDLAGATGVPALLVELVLEELRDRGLAVFSRTFGGRVRVHRLGPVENERPAGR